MRLLVVEDEKDMNRLIVKTLQQAGYTVDSCLDGLEAMDYLDSADYDGLILDVMLPGKNGHEIITSLRQKKNALPVLFLSARDSVADRVRGLDLGADDYLIKPFDFEELMARIRAMTRKHVGQRKNQFSVGDLVVDVERHTVTRGGVPLSLLPKEFAILEHLMLHRDRWVSQEELMEHVLESDANPFSNVVRMHISSLRKKLRDALGDDPIQTKVGQGYRLMEKETL